MLLGHVPVCNFQCVLASLAVRTLAFATSRKAERSVHQRTGAITSLGLSLAGSPEHRCVKLPLRCVGNPNKL